MDAILQTRDGYLWLGTKGGLSRFDGVRFTTFDDRINTQLRESEVRVLAEGVDGSLWIGTYGGGVSQLKDGKFTVYTTADGLINNYVASLCDRRSRREDISGSETDGGLSRFQNERFVNYVTEDRLAGAVPGILLDPPTAACGSAPPKALSQ